MLATAMAESPFQVNLIRTLFSMRFLLVVVGYCFCMGTATASERGVRFSDFINEIIYHHPAVQSSQFQIESADAAQKTAQYGFFPTPSITVDRLVNGRLGTQADLDPTEVVLSLEQPIWTGGRLTATLEKAEAEGSLAEAELEETQERLINTLIQSWTELTVANHKLDAVNASLDTHKRLLKMVERRMNEGMSATADFALAASRIAIIEAEVQLLNAQRNQAIESLSSLLGRNLSQDHFDLAIELPVFSPESLSNMVLLAKQRNPGVRKSQQRSRVSTAEIKLSRASVYPEVSLRLQHRRGGAVAPETTDVTEVYLSVSSSLGPGLSRFTQVDSAHAQYQSSLEQVKVAQQAIEEQVRSNWALWQAAQSRVSSLGQANDASDDVLVSYERQFLAGRKQWLDLMNAVRERAQTASQAADAYGALQLSGLRLLLLTHGPVSLAAKLRYPE